MDRWQRLVGLMDISQMLSIKSHHPFFFPPSLFLMSQNELYNIYSLRGYFIIIKFKVNFFFIFIITLHFHIFVALFTALKQSGKWNRKGINSPRIFLHLSLFGISEQQNTADPETQKCNNKAVEFLEKQWYQQSKLHPVLKNWVAYPHPTPPLSSLPIRNIGWGENRTPNQL